MSLPAAFPLRRAPKTVDPWIAACMSADEWADWQRMNNESATARKVRLDRPCGDCPHGFAAEMRAVDKCNGSPGVEEDEDVDEHQAAGAAANAANYAARREGLDLAGVSVAAPCGTCAHAAVCRIKAALDGWDEVSVRLPALDDALTVTLAAKVECSYWQRKNRSSSGPSGTAAPTTYIWTPEQRAAQGERMRARRKAEREAAST